VARATASCFLAPQPRAIRCARGRRPRAGLRPTPSLAVHFPGVPDTTPEFVDAAKLDAYLGARIEGVRGDSARKP
jgi:hypothetical protein